MEGLGLKASAVVRQSFESGRVGPVVLERKSRSIPLKYASLKDVQFIVGQSFSQGAEEGMVVGCVVDHEQYSSQQLIGHQQVVQVRPLVVLTAVADTPLDQGPEVIFVSGSKFKES